MFSLSLSLSCERVSTPPSTHKLLKTIQESLWQTSPLAIQMLNSLKQNQITPNILAMLAYKNISIFNDKEHLNILSKPFQYCK